MAFSGEEADADSDGECNESSSTSGEGFFDPTQRSTKFVFSICSFAVIYFIRKRSKRVASYDDVDEDEKEPELPKMKRKIVRKKVSIRISMESNVCDRQYLFNCYFLIF